MFIIDKKIASSRDRLRRSLEHSEWVTVEDGTIGANRLRLPNEPHFDRVAAFICTELWLNGVDEDPTTAFRRIEKLIEQELIGGDDDSRALVGLCGEVLLLDALVRAEPDLATAILIDSWAGYKPSTRDLQLGAIGVEIKTTTKATSRHHIQGLYQVELGSPVDGAPETGLYLLSIGLIWLPAGDPGFTLPSIVDELAAQLSSNDREQFRARVSRYAGAKFDAGLGLVSHEFSRPFTTGFVRLYDLGDPRIRMPSSADFSGHYVVPDSVRFEVDLPAQVTGHLNPINGMPSAAAQIIRAAGK